MGALWTLSRPRLTPAVLLLPFLGWLWAHWDRGLDSRRPWALVVVIGGWWALHAGTMWLNAARDRDQGPVLLGEAAEVPAYTVPAGFAALGLAVGLCRMVDGSAGLWALLCAGLAIAYSWPACALKGHPLGGPLVNVLGYGVASPAAGWAVADVGFNARTALAWLVFVAGILGAYFVAQAFQEDEDRARGDRTLVATHGARVVWRAARLCFALGYAIAGAMMLAGWLPRVCLFALPSGWWLDAHLRRVSDLPAGGGPEAAEEAGRRLAVIALLVFVLSMIPYVRDSLRGGPVAGLATVAGHPVDHDGKSMFFDSSGGV